MTPAQGVMTSSSTANYTEPVQVAYQPMCTAGENAALPTHV